MEMEEELFFGIGCFHFGLRKTVEGKFTGEKYVNGIRDALEAIPSVDDLTLGVPPDLLIVTWTIKEPSPLITEGQGHFPDFTSTTSVGLQVEFTVRIPYRIQAELLELEPELDSVLSTTSTEQFRVVCCYSYYGPVTFIIPLNPQRAANPSNAVRVVRDFLRIEFAKARSSIIRFEALGPSPFHTNCVIRHDEEPISPEWPLVCNEVLSSGYSRTEFLYDESLLDSPEIAFEFLLMHITDELGFFFNLRQLEDAKRRAWSEIDQIIDSLSDLQTREGPMAVLKRAATSSSLITRGFVKLARYESSEMHTIVVIQQDYSDVYTTGHPPCFKRHIDKLIAQTYKAPTAAALRVLELSEARRSKHTDTIVLLISSLLGGAVGALLTLWLSK